MDLLFLSGLYFFGLALLCYAAARSEIRNKKYLANREPNPPPNFAYLRETRLNE